MQYLFSGQFSDTVFENIAYWFVDHWVDNSSDGVNSSNNGTNLNKKSDKALPILRNILSNRWKLEVEIEDVLTVCFFLVMGNFVIWDKLINVISRQSFLKVAWNSDQIKHSFKPFWDILITIFFVFWCTFEPITRMLHIKILKRSLNVVKISFVSERYVVNLVSEIKMIAFLSQHLNNIAISMGSNMEIAWYSVGFEESF